MNANDSHKQSQLLEKYEQLYRSKPRSRVFAPLAETYRKLGNSKRALEILKKGFVHHPDYVLGFIVLANIYSEDKNFDDAYSVLTPFIAENRDNLSLQKLYSNICEEIGRYEEALDVNKFLLLLNPRDREVAEKVSKLEIKCEAIRPQVPSSELFGEDEGSEWVQKDFSREKIEENIKDDIDNWNVERNPMLESFKNQIKSEVIEVKEHSLDDDYFYEEYDCENDDTNEDEQLDPIITHTLVDLYLSQGFKAKAVSVLEGILASHPNDEATIHKLKSIQVTSKVVEETNELEELDRSVEIFKLKEMKTLHNKLSTFLAIVRNESKSKNEKYTNH